MSKDCDHNHKYLFVLSPPFSGSTLLWKLLATSDNVSSMSREGQHLDSTKDIMRGRHWDPTYTIPWQTIKTRWEQEWNLDKLILLEKSPPNLLRADAIEKTFQPAYFVGMIGDPYAFCEGYLRRQPDQTLQNGIDLWIKCARYQMRNFSSLQRVIWFKYSTLTENTEATLQKIIDFLPSLKKIDTHFEGMHSVLGRNQQEIKNINKIKRNRLSRRQIRTINRTLIDHDYVLEYFGFTLMDPEDIRTTTYLQMKTITFMTKVLRILRDEYGIDNRLTRSLEKSFTQRLDQLVS